MSDVEVRPEGRPDRDAIAEVVAAAFASQALARLVADIRASDRSWPDLNLVAECDGAIVGHVMISATDLHTAEGVIRIPMLSPLAVAPAAQGRGIGSALVRAAARRTDARGERCIVLEGSPAYYGRFGFEHARPLGIDISLPAWASDEAGQVLRLGAWGDGVRGEVRYPPAFDGLE